MTYYTPDNPNHTLLSRHREQPVLRGIRITLIVLLSVLLTVSLVLTLFSASIRISLTPEYVYLYTFTLDFPEFPLPVDGSFQSISQLMQNAFNDVGFNLKEEDIELLFDQFSIPTIMACFAQDFTSWLLHDGPRPVLDPDEIAAVALSGVDSSIMTILRFLGDPVALVGNILTGPLSQLDTDTFFDSMEPVRTLLSVHTLTLLVSVSALLAVLLFCLCRCRFTAFCLPLGIVTAVVCLLIAAIGFILSYVLPNFTAVYAEYLSSPLVLISCKLWRYSLIGVMIAFLLVCVWSIHRMFCRRSQHAEEPPADSCEV